MLTKDEVKRYERQISIFGEEGQRKLKKAKVFIAGAGGLGSSISIYLTVAGIGKLRMVDNDIVALENLNRQILHRDNDIGKKKLESAEEKLKKMNSNVEVEVIFETINIGNIDELVGDFDMIVDAMDNFATRYVLNKTALMRKIPLFHGAVHGFYGQATTIIPGKTACLRCIFPEVPPPTVPPVVGVTPGVVGCIQATEVIKYILGIGDLLENRLLMWDGLNAVMDEVPLEKNPRCEDCGKEGG
ncbi:MAG: HesA/MoeB/ThiF family protein [Dehalococcoidia bacterium]|nr:MAG: HesA/MoeB/ThiF family protein [Dehalococcoidia bacterium]